MVSYDTRQFDPPAPVAYVDVCDPGSDNRIARVLALIDTGADITMIPQSVVTQLGLEPKSGEAYELVDFAGQTSYALSIGLKLSFCGRVFSCRFLIVDQPWAIVGRNVLNQLTLVLDGPNMQWEELSTSA